jgi:acyl transferase domain-containing protein/acyl carrier protein
MSNSKAIEIAIIGISCNFPKSLNYKEFWNNLKNGTEMIHHYDTVDKKAAYNDSEESKKRVNSRGIIQEKNYFDHSFFGYRSEEASLMDPQIRLFHEHCWKALEDAGCVNNSKEKKIGIFSTASDNFNWRAYNCFQQQNSLTSLFYSDQLSNKEFTSLLVAYALNLRGPAMHVNTSCSSSLSVVHLACRSLLFRECSIAIAGAVSLNTKSEIGYEYESGMILSPDGHCRSFDKESNGTVPGEGIGVVVLKRLEDAIKDRDQIYAVIKSTALTNDGNQKIGFTAPSIEGQCEAITMAHNLAGIDPRSITYIETHGTGTRLGDPIEIAALNTAFRSAGKEKFCAIGSVKSNLGHLDTAAGMAGLIKTILSLKYKEIPPSLYYESPNPEIDFDGGPFYVNTVLKAWENNGNTLRRAGVSSFGVGGTNAHIVLEESPFNECIQNVEENYELLNLSAKTKQSLLRYIATLNSFLSDNNIPDLTDLSYTLQVGRQDFAYRKSIVYKTKSELIDSLKEIVSDEIINLKNIHSNIVFMFPGQGSQYINMGRELYRSNAIFRNKMDEGFSIIENFTGQDFKSILYPVSQEHQSRINNTCYAQPIIFLLEYSLASLMLSYGLRPTYMIGHSIGEYTAACISGVFSFKDALKLVIKRGEIMNTLNEGGMLSVNMSEGKARAYLSDDISLASINGPEQVVFSGNLSNIENLISKLEVIGIPYIKLHTSHAFHSSLLDPILEEFTLELNKIDFNSMQVPFISNLTGLFIKNEEATSPGYWTQHLRNTVKFSQGLKTILTKNESFIFIEVGAGYTLSHLLKLQPLSINSIAANLIKGPRESVDDEMVFAKAIGKLWENGVTIDWNVYYKKENRRIISLPTYSFERVEQPTEVDLEQTFHSNNNIVIEKRNPISDWFNTIIWKSGWRSPKTRKDSSKHKVILVFSNDERIEKQLNSFKSISDSLIIYVNPSNKYAKKDHCLYAIDPSSEADFEKLFLDLKLQDMIPTCIYHFWTFDTDKSQELDDYDDFQLKIGYESLLKIACSFNSIFSKSELELCFVSNGLYKVLGHERIFPIKSTAIGALKTISQEFQGMSYQVIDMADASEKSMNVLCEELLTFSKYDEISIRGINRYKKDFEKIEFTLPDKYENLKIKGTYVITGAMGGMGQLFSNYLAKEFKANLILIGRNESKQENIEKLENFGAKVFYIKADISEYEKIKNAINVAEESFGCIHGVIHAAGVADFSGIIIKRTKEDDEKVFRPKINGTKVLNSIFKDRNLDFFINCSSKSASLQLVGQVSYVASNLYQDAFAEKGNQNYPIISIEWDTLKDSGMAFKAINKSPGKMSESQLNNGITENEAIQILRTALYLEIPTQIISIKNLKEVIAVQKQFFQDLDKQLNENSINTVSKTERPKLSTIFILPISETELKLTSLFESFFGIQNIGVEDDFFELGGDSLKAMIVLKIIKKEFDVNLLLKDFFEGPNIRKISTGIDERIWINKSSEKQYSTII